MNAIEKAQAAGWRKIYFNIGTIPYWAVHIAAVVGLWLTGFTWVGVAWLVGGFYARIFFVTAGYHRYFSHRSYKTSRWFQFLLALGATATVQKGPLWWAHHHRHHHRRSDMDDDIHSVKQGGFWWAHMGWFLADDFEATDYDKIKDMAKYPELRFLDKFHVLVPIALGVITYFAFGAVALWWGFFAATVLSWHGTFTINSMMHTVGRQRYESKDESRNTLTLAILTMGEGWHNNHHYYQVSCRQGFRWWQIDLTFYILKVLSWFRIVSDLRAPPRHIIEARRKHDRAEPDSSSNSSAGARPHVA